MVSQKPLEESSFIHLSSTFCARLLAGNIVVNAKFLNFMMIILQERNIQLVED